MKAAVLKKPWTLRVEDVPEPVADETFALLDVKACGICGSDIRYYMGENPWALHTLGKVIPNPPNIIFGHEIAGVVKEVKRPEYEHLLGKRVFVISFKTCGQCEACRSGNYNLCKETMHLGHGAGWGEQDYFPGGMAELCPVWYTNMIELPEDVSCEEATLLDPISVAIHAVTLSGIKPGQKVLVLGSGPVGISIIQAVQAFGAGTSICTDVCEFPLKLIEKWGIAHTVDASKADVVSYVKREMGGADVVFDTVGTAQSQRQALDVLKKGGTLVNLVANETQSAYRLSDLSGERRILTSANNRYEDCLLALDLIQRGIIRAKDMVTHVLPLEDVQHGFDMMMDKKRNDVMKVVLRP